MGDTYICLYMEEGKKDCFFLCKSTTMPHELTELILETTFKTESSQE